MSNDLSNTGGTSFEDQCLELKKESIDLQKVANKRLKDIDTTLDWFFWIMILGIIGFIILTFLTAI